MLQNVKKRLDKKMLKVIVWSWPLLVYIVILYRFSMTLATIPVFLFCHKEVLFVEQISFTTQPYVAN